MKLSYILDEPLIESLKILEVLFSKTAQTLDLLPEKIKDSLHKYALVSMVGASTRIENALLTDCEVNWLDTVLSQDGKITSFDANREMIENKLSKDRERSIEEVAGCRSMLLLIYESFQGMSPLKETDIRGLHYELMATYAKAIPYAGAYKTQSNSVVEENHRTGQRRVVFKTADAGPITTSAMADLLAWYSKMGTHPWPIAVTCELVFRFLAIHPFQDGNGRLGRGLFLLSLLQGSSPSIQAVAPYLAIDRFVERHREEYYSVLNRCSHGQYRGDPTEYEVQHFLNFMIKVLKEALQNISVLQKRYDVEQQLSSTALKILYCFRDFPEVSLTTAEVIKHTQIPRRTVVYGLNQLREALFIQRLGQGAGTRYQITF